MKVKAANNVIVVTPQKMQKMSGSFIESVQKKQPEIGKVTELGKPKKDETLPVKGLKVGDVIAYRRFGESKFFIDSKEVIFIDFADVLGIIEKGKDAK